MALYRNNDIMFERLMAGQTAERKMPVTMTMEAVDGGFELNGHFFAAEHQEAQKPQRENIVRQLSKLGGTPYACEQVRLIPDDFNYFIPSSMLADWRRTVLAQRISESESRNDNGKEFSDTDLSDLKVPSMVGGLVRTYPYLYNVSNAKARAFYAAQGVADATAMEVSFTKKYPNGEPILMQCRHCLRYSLGYCVKNGGDKPFWKEPLYLVSDDGRRFRLEFDCRNCQMNVYGCQI